MSTPRLPHVHVPTPRVSLPSLPTPQLPQLPGIPGPCVSMPNREAVVRAAKAALPWFVIAGELGVLLLPLIAPYLAPALAAQLLALAPYLAVALGLVA